MIAASELIDYNGSTTIESRSNSNSVWDDEEEDYYSSTTKKEYFIFLFPFGEDCLN